ncbi:sulfite exporter TauE/SafE family protein [Flavobacterium sp. ANB]|uniref:sulfite exporter TauE/SafE family protein n=1 Tax=unclassified Flavobacterium TaxID=196869 RepID=UPI0012B6BB07|nr:MULTISPECIES: sulfite exporter TauE/SafE family protein [unclassified Flavobacterium]MBF4519468.1 sulfite exporter TauE/SafE family protein [Flavobacterium sp. ANB]MTD72546.1 TSUP family transporter [Flavobacterium sp. LC2016-13]
MNSYFELFFLFLMAFIGSAANVTIGGGWFIIFPSLIFRGIQPVTGTATTTIILLSGFLASSKPSKKTGEISKRHFNYMVLACTIGGVTGAFLLIAFSHKVFESIAPYLLLCSWILFSFYNQIQHYFNSEFAVRKEFKYSHEKLILIFLLGIYGGYFGAGMGMIVFILFSFYGIKNNDTLERLALFLVGANNGIAILIFTCSGLIFWPFAIVMMAGSILGGYLGNAFKEKINITMVKKNAIVIGATVTLYFLL